MGYQISNFKTPFCKSSIACKVTICLTVIVFIIALNSFAALHQVPGASGSNRKNLPLPEATESKLNPNSIADPGSEARRKSEVFSGHHNSNLRLRRSVGLKRLNANHPYERLKNNKLLDGLSEEERESILHSHLERTASNRGRVFLNVAERSRSASEEADDTNLSVIKENKGYTKISFEDLITKIPTISETLASENFENKFKSNSALYSTSTVPSEASVGSTNDHSNVFHHIKRFRKFTFAPNFITDAIHFRSANAAAESKELEGLAVDVVPFANVKVASLSKQNFTVPPSSRSVESRSGSLNKNDSEAFASVDSYPSSSTSANSLDVTEIWTSTGHVESTQSSASPETTGGKVGASSNFAKTTVISGPKVDLAEQKLSSSERSQTSAVSTTPSVISNSSVADVSHDSSTSASTSSSNPATSTSSTASTSTSTSLSSTTDSTSTSTSTSTSISSTTESTSTSSTSSSTTSGVILHEETVSQSESFNAEKTGVSVVSTYQMYTVSNESLKPTVQSDTKSSEATFQVTDLTSERTIEGSELPATEKIKKKPLHTAGREDATAAFVFLSLGLVILFAGLFFLFKITKPRSRADSVLPYSSSSFTDA